MAADCGGAGGERRPMLSHAVDAAFEALPPLVCGSPAPVLDCAAPFKPATAGYVNDFSYREWNGSKWCGEGDMHGSIFSFKGSGANDAASIGVNTTDASLRLSLTVSKGSYGGGGMAFESGCVDATAFAGVQFTLAVGSGSLAGCAYQMQLQTFEQRPTSQTPPGGCDQNLTTCYSFPYVRDNLPPASMDPTMPTLVSLPFSRFSVSAMPAPAQLVGLQWQVNSTSDQCTVELRIDDVAFIPAAPPPEPGDDAGASD
jgi:hypothetical protein